MAGTRRSVVNVCVLYPQPARPPRYGLLPTLAHSILSDQASRRTREREESEVIILPVIPEGVGSEPSTEQEGGGTSAVGNEGLDNMGGASADGPGDIVGGEGLSRRRARQSARRGFSLSESDMAEDEDREEDIVSTTTESHLGLDDEISVDLGEGEDRSDGGQDDGRDHEHGSRDEGNHAVDGSGHGEGDDDATRTGRSSRGRTRRRTGSSSASSALDAARSLEGVDGEECRAAQGGRRGGGEGALLVSADQADSGSRSATKEGGATGDAAAVGDGGVNDGAGRLASEAATTEPLPGQSTANGTASSTAAGTGSEGRTFGTSQTSTSTASSGPGAKARDEGWSDRELLLGLLQPEDAPVVAAHDVSRSVGGVQVKRGLLLVSRNAVYCVDGFGRGPPGVRPPGKGGGGSGQGAAVVAPSTPSTPAGRNSKDPLHGVRRLEEWELGGGAGGIAGVGEDDGEAGGGAKIQVTLRRKSANDLTGKGGSGKGGGGTRSGTALTTEQAGVAAGGGRVGGEVEEIVALGNVGMQRIVLDQVWCPMSK